MSRNHCSNDWKRWELAADMSGLRDGCSKLSQTYFSCFSCVWFVDERSPARKRIQFDDCQACAEPFSWNERAASDMNAEHWCSNSWFIINSPDHICSVDFSKQPILWLIIKLPFRNLLWTILSPITCLTAEEWMLFSSALLVSIKLIS